MPRNALNTEEIPLLLHRRATFLLRLLLPSRPLLPAHLPLPSRLPLPPRLTFPPHINLIPPQDSALVRRRLIPSPPTFLTVTPSSTSRVHLLPVAAAVATAAAATTAAALVEIESRACGLAAVVKTAATASPTVRLAPAAVLNPTVHRQQRMLLSLSQRPQSEPRCPPLIILSHLQVIHRYPLP